jgi:hypothetical protein
VTRNIKLYEYGFHENHDYNNVSRINNWTFGVQADYGFVGAILGAKKERLLRHEWHNIEPVFRLSQQPWYGWTICTHVHRQAHYKLWFWWRNGPKCMLRIRNVSMRCLCNATSNKLQYWKQIFG